MNGESGGGGFKLFGLIAITAGFVVIYALFYQGLDFNGLEQEIANWTRLPVFGKTPGDAIPAPQPIKTTPLSGIGAPKPTPVQPIYDKGGNPQ